MVGNGVGNALAAAPDAEPRPRIFIQTNPKQILGAIVAAHAAKRNSRHADAFDVEILNTADYPFFAEHEGRLYIRDGSKRPWRNGDLQSFTPIRFMPPERMGYRGRALMIDPDVFAVADVWDLLSRDMGGKAILCRRREGWKGLAGHYASSAMLLDCAKLDHWQCEANFREMFAFKRDYRAWVSLKMEPAGSIGLFEPEWNDFDRLRPSTRMLHNTRRMTQPWKTGLPVDFMPTESFALFPPYGWLMRWRRERFGDHAFLGRYLRHPDRQQEQFFFGLLRECLAAGLVSESFVQEQMAQNHVRHDALDVVSRTPVPAPVL